MRERLDREGVPEEDRLPWTEPPEAFLDQKWIQETADEAIEAATRHALQCGMDIRTEERGGRVKLEYAILVEDTKPADQGAVYAS